MKNLCHLSNNLINVSASPGTDPNPRGEGQLHNPNRRNSTLTSGTGDIDQKARRGGQLLNPNKCHSTLTSAIRGRC